MATKSGSGSGSGSGYHLQVPSPRSSDDKKASVSKTSKKSPRGFRESVAAGPGDRTGSKVPNLRCTFGAAEKGMLY